mmetsp:Transcript_28910/g.92327  ORF Transcript_28910/g.92327 Transcript_28910/m.92327 type:complete len:238 (-) Transcript_28910:103-816(-)
MQLTVSTLAKVPTAVVARVRVTTSPSASFLAGGALVGRRGAAKAPTAGAREGAGWRRLFSAHAEGRPGRPGRPGADHLGRGRVRLRLEPGVWGQRGAAHHGEHGRGRGGRGRRRRQGVDHAPRGGGLLPRARARRGAPRERGWGGGRPAGEPRQRPLRAGESRHAERAERRLGVSGGGACEGAGGRRGGPGGGAGRGGLVPGGDPLGEPAGDAAGAARAPGAAVARIVNVPAPGVRV